MYRNEISTCVHRCITRNGLYWKRGNLNTLQRFQDLRFHPLVSQLKGKSAPIWEDLQVQSSELFRKDLTKPYRSYKHLTRSMRTCTYILTVIWPTMSVAKATRHSRLSQGCVFSLGLSRSYQGQAPETNLDNPEVSR